MMVRKCDKKCKISLESSYSLHFQPSLKKTNLVSQFGATFNVKDTKMTSAIIALMLLLLLQPRSFFCKSSEQFLTFY